MIWRRCVPGRVRLVVRPGEILLVPKPPDRPTFGDVRF